MLLIFFFCIHWFGFTTHLGSRFENCSRLALIWALITSSLHRAPPLRLALHSSGIYDLRTSTFMHDVGFVISDVLGSPTSPLSLDALIAAATAGTDAVGWQNPPSAAPLLALTLPGLANVSVGLRAVRLSHLAAVHDLVFEVRGQSDLGTSLNVSGAEMHAEIWYHIVPLDGKLSGPPLHDTSTISLSLRQLSATVDMRLEVNSACLASLSGLELDSSGCIPSCINALSVLRLNTALQTDNTTFHPVVHSPDIDSSVAVLLATLAAQYVDVWPLLLNGIDSGPLLDAVNVEIASLLGNAPNCNKHPAQSWLPSYVAGGACGLVLLLLWVCVFGARRRSRSLGQYDCSDAVPDCGARDALVVPVTGGINVSEAEAVAEDRARLLGCSDKTASSEPCLAASPAVGTVWVVVMPLLLVGTTWLLVASYTRFSIAAVPSIMTNGTRVDIGIIKALKYTTTVPEMWQAGVYVLCTLIVVFSGILPTVKLLILIYAWVAPAAWLPVASREWILTVCICVCVCSV